MINQYLARLGAKASIALSPKAILPTLATVRDSHGYSGFSTTYHYNNGMAALGELIERQHFFYGIIADSYGTIANHCSKNFCNSFKKLVQQTTNHYSEEKIDEYRFELTSCIHIITEQAADIPTILLSLGHSKDNFWIPDRDTCGCASHTDPQQTFQSALLEFIERQNLIATWLSERCRYRVMLNNLAKFLPLEFQRLINQFMDAGHLTVINTSLLFNCYSIMVLFIAQSDEQHVKFSLGSACAVDPIAALKKALLEMCQSFTLMSEVHHRVDKNAYRSKKNTYEKLTINFCDANRREIIKEFAYLFFDKTPIMSLEDYTNLPIYSLETIIQELSNISSQLFYYSAMLSLGDQQCFIGRIVSPDFFICMDNQNRSFNLDNLFSERLFIKSNKKISLPFS